MAVEPLCHELQPELKSQTINETLVAPCGLLTPCARRLFSASISHDMVRPRSGNKPQNEGHTAHASPKDVSDL